VKHTRNNIRVLTDNFDYKFFYKFLRYSSETRFHDVVIYMSAGSIYYYLYSI